MTYQEKCDYLEGVLVKLLQHHDLPPYRLRFTEVAALGQVHYWSATIKLNLHFVDLNAVTAAELTLRHEVAHILTYRDMGMHGHKTPLFKHYCEVLGTHQYSRRRADAADLISPKIVGARWKVVCVCGKDWYFKRRTKRVADGFNHCTCPYCKADSQFTVSKI